MKNIKRLGCWLMLHKYKYINKDHIECLNCGMIVNDKGDVRKDFAKQFRTERIVGIVFPIILITILLVYILIS